MVEASKNLPRVSLHGKEYVPVKDRLALFRSYYGDSASIATEVLHNSTNTGGTVLVRATIGIAGRVIANGHAESIRGDGAVNSSSPVEATETRAIGRALAALGLAGGEYASADEMTKPGVVGVNPIKQDSLPAVKGPILDKPTVGMDLSNEYATWKDVAHILITGLSLQESLEDLNSYYKANQPVIDELSQIEPSTHSDLLAAFSERKKELS